MRKSPSGMEVFIVFGAVKPSQPHNNVMTATGCCDSFSDSCSTYTWHAKSHLTTSCVNY